MVDVKKISAELKNITTGEDQHKDGMSKKRAAFSGVLIGMIAGLLVGYSQNWNMFLSIAGGGLAGGLAVGMISPKD